MKFFYVKHFFRMSLISKISVKMNLRIITKNHAADLEIGFLTRSISNWNGHADNVGVKKSLLIPTQ